MDITPSYISDIVERNKELWALKKKTPQLFGKKLHEWEKSIAKRLKRLRGSTTQKPFMSVVIPARNEEAYILPTLESIAEQKNVKNIEVVVIANNCSQQDTTAHICKNAGVRVFEYNYASKNEKPIALARHIGLIFSEGDIYVSTDADTVAMPHWLDKLSAKLLSNKNTAIVTSHSHLYQKESSKKVQLNDIQRAFMRESFNWTGLTGIGHNAMFRRKDAEKIGGYSTRVYPGEDSYISFMLSTMRLKSLEFVYESDAEVWISPRRILKYGGYFFVSNFFKIYKGSKGEHLNAREKLAK